MIRPHDLHCSTDKSCASEWPPAVSLAYDTRASFPDGHVWSYQMQALQPLGSLNGHNMCEHLGTNTVHALLPLLLLQLQLVHVLATGCLPLPQHG